MATTEVYIGSAPADEECAQVGTAGFAFRAKIECEAFRQQLKRLFGEQEGAPLLVFQQPHGAGDYFYVGVLVKDGDKEGWKYARKVEALGPMKWDAEALEYIAGMMK